MVFLMGSPSEDLCLAASQRRSPYIQNWKFSTSTFLLIISQRNEIPYFISIHPSIFGSSWWELKDLCFLEQKVHFSVKTWSEKAKS